MFGENSLWRQVLVNLIGLLLVLSFLFVVFYYTGSLNIQERVASAGIWAWLLLILAKIAVFVFAPLSGTPVYLVAGALFGFWEGFILLTIGDIIGGTIAFYISRVFGRPLVERIIGDETHFLNRALRITGSVRGFLAARLLFIPAQEIPCYAAGLTRIHYIPFILIHTLVGMIPTAAITGLGSATALINNPLFMTMVVAVGIIMIPLILIVSRFIIGTGGEAVGETRNEKSL